ncbi:hypothetical protein, partial [Flavobacterium sp. A45]|uniref:hypothetical protein n=1 Tax=Flavobacterium sp. A45 TaxID=1945862 RepID=UPI0009D4FF0B
MRTIFFRANLLIYFFSIQVFGQISHTTNSISFRDERDTYLISSQPFPDKDGFVWYAVNTQGTFYKYDGTNTIKYTYKGIKEKELSISNLNIYSWIQDGKGDIWAINHLGAYIINPKTFNVRYIKWELKHKIRSKEDVVSLLDKKSNIWISLGENYVIKIDTYYNQKIYVSPKEPKEIKYIKQNSEVVNTESGALRIIRELDQGKILVKSHCNLYVIDDKGIHFVLHLKSDKPNLHFVGNGEIFKNNASGVVFFDGKKYNYTYLKNLNIQMFDCPYDNFLYSKTYFFTVRDNKIYTLLFDKEKNTFTTIDTFFLKRNILSKQLRLDSNGIIWFSNNVKIVMLKPFDLRFKKYLQGNDSQISVKGMTSDSSGNLYVCSSSGIFKLNANDKSLSKIHKTSYSRNIYNSILIEKDSVLWFVGGGPFVNSINLRTNVLKTIKYEDRWNFKSIFLKSKSKDSLWIGSDKGLFIFDKKSEKLFQYKINNINSDGLIIYDLLQSINGNLWIATNKGLYFKDKGNKFI